MTATAFAVTNINRLRSRASNTRRVPDEVPEGWSKSSVDLSAVVAAFEVLHVKPGYAFRGYQFRSGGNGNGVVWALPEDAPFPEADDCPRLPEFFLNPP